MGSQAILDLAGQLNDAAMEEREKHGVGGWEAGTGTARMGFDD